MRRILAPQTRRATSFHTCCSHLPGDLPKGLQNDGIGEFGMRTRLWRAAEGGSRAPTRPLDRSNLNFDDRETFFATDLGHPHAQRQPNRGDYCEPLPPARRALCRYRRYHSKRLKQSSRRELQTTISPIPCIGMKSLAEEVVADGFRLDLRYFSILL